MAGGIRNPDGSISHWDDPEAQKRATEIYEESQRKARDKTEQPSYQSTRRFSFSSENEANASAAEMAWQERLKILAQLPERHHGETARQPRDPEVDAAIWEQDSIIFDLFQNDTDAFVLWILRHKREEYDLDEAKRIYAYAVDLAQKLRLARLAKRSEVEEIEFYVYKRGQRPPMPTVSFRDYWYVPATKNGNENPDDPHGVFYALEGLRHKARPRHKAREDYDEKITAEHPDGEFDN